MKYKIMALIIMSLLLMGCGDSQPIEEEICTFKGSSFNVWIYNTDHVPIPFKLLTTNFADGQNSTQTGTSLPDGNKISLVSYMSKQNGTITLYYGKDYVNEITYTVSGCMPKQNYSFQVYLPQDQVEVDYQCLSDDGMLVSDYPKQVIEYSTKCKVILNGYDAKVCTEIGKSKQESRDKALQCIKPFLQDKGGKLK